MLKRLMLLAAISLASGAKAAQVDQEDARYSTHQYDQSIEFGYLPGESTIGIIHADVSYGSTMWSVATGVGAMGPGVESHGIFYLGYQYKHFSDPVSKEVSTYLGLPEDAQYSQHKLGFFDHIYFAPMELGGKRIKTHYDVYGYYSTIGDFWSLGTGLKLGLGFTPIFESLYVTLHADGRPGVTSSAVWDKGLGFAGELDTTIELEWLVNRPLSIYAQWQNYWLWHKFEPLDLAKGASIGFRYSWGFQ